jgi:glycosyltransferase involved in cell wall biosynthesis
MWRGPLDVITAFSQVAKEKHNVRLMIASPRDDPVTKHYCERIINNLNLNSKIIWKGFCNDIYREILMPSTTICLPFRSYVLDPPLTILEAMATGKPVITTKLGGIQEFIKDGETGFLIDVMDIKALVQKIRMTLLHTESAQEIGKRARERILAMCNWNLVIKEMLKIIKEVARA